MLLILKNAADLHLQLQKYRTGKIGFVPTMGALHPGHLTLIKASKQLADLTVCSIFVNPTQFNDSADFAKYPKTLEQDIEQLDLAGCDILFLPEVADIYPTGTNNLESFELGHLESVYEGKYRPGHFQGVCQVMKRLLNLIQPTDLFMGQKDYQQCMVVKKLNDLEGIHLQFHTIPTIRETSGLAMSSRNLRLSTENREKAATIHQCMQRMKQSLEIGVLNPLVSAAHQQLERESFRIDYLEFANAETLETITEWNGKQELVILAAVFLQEVRLIDNLLISH